MTRNYPRWIQSAYHLCRPLLRLLEKTPAEGAATTLFLASHVVDTSTRTRTAATTAATTASTGGGGGGGGGGREASSGRYWVNSQSCLLPKCADSTLGCQLLWELSERLTDTASALTD